MLLTLLFVGSIIVALSARWNDPIADMVGLSCLSLLTPMTFGITLKNLLALLLVVPAVTTVGCLLRLTVLI